MSGAPVWRGFRKLGVCWFRGIGSNMQILSIYNTGLSSWRREIFQTCRILIASRLVCCAISRYSKWHCPVRIFYVSINLISLQDKDRM